MAAAADVRDMLDLPAESQPRPHKKQKVVEKRPGMYPKVSWLSLSDS
jgi:DNA methyltransferase 1-associated protein 1